MIDLSQLKKNDVIVTEFGDIARVNGYCERSNGIYVFYLDRIIRLTNKSVTMDIICNKDGTSVYKDIRIVKILKGDSDG